MLTVASTALGIVDNFSGVSFYEKISESETFRRWLAAALSARPGDQGMNRIVRQGAATVMALCLSAQARSQSFDCKKATTRVEKMICRSAPLSELDSALAALYRGAAHTLGGERVHRDQRAWLQRREACTDERCVEDALKNRIAQLSPPASVSTPAPEPTPPAPDPASVSASDTIPEPSPAPLTATNVASDAAPDSPKLHLVSKINEIHEAVNCADYKADDIAASIIAVGAQSASVISVSLLKCSIDGLCSKPDADVSRLLLTNMHTICVAAVAVVGKNGSTGNVAIEIQRDEAQFATLLN